MSLKENTFKSTLCDAPTRGEGAEAMEIGGGEGGGFSVFAGLGHSGRTYQEDSRVCVCVIMMDIATDKLAQKGDGHPRWTDDARL